MPMQPVPMQFMVVQMQPIGNQPFTSAGGSNSQVAGPYLAQPQVMYTSAFVPSQSIQAPMNSGPMRETSGPVQETSQPSQESAPAEQKRKPLKLLNRSVPVTPAVQAPAAEAAPAQNVVEGLETRRRPSRLSNKPIERE